MSSSISTVINPESLTALKLLANAAFLDATDVPKDIRSRLPPDAALVTTLLKANTPAHLPATFILRSVGLCTSPLKPNWSIDKLFKTPVPPRAWIGTLEENLSQLWTTGVCSISPPSSSSPDLRFPLWIVNFWYTAVEVAEQKAEWKAAEEWLLKRVQDSEIRQARNLFGKVPWGLRLWSLTGHDGESRIGHLAGLLSNKWLGERQVNAISSYLNARARQESGSNPTSLVAGLDLQAYLSYGSRATAEALRAHTGLKMYAQQVSDHKYSRLFIPAHVGGNHWIVFSVDFKKQMFEYGELIEYVQIPSLT